MVWAVPGRSPAKVTNRSGRRGVDEGALLRHHLPGLPDRGLVSSRINCLALVDLCLIIGINDLPRRLGYFALTVASLAIRDLTAGVVPPFGADVPSIVVALAGGGSRDGTPGKLKSGYIPECRPLGSGSGESGSNSPTVGSRLGPFLCREIPPIDQPRLVQRACTPASKSG